MKDLGFRTLVKLNSEIKKVRELRNKIIHFAYTPSIKEAEQAYEVINQFLWGIKKPPLIAPNLQELRQLYDSILEDDLPAMHGTAVTKMEES